MKSEKLVNMLLVDDEEKLLFGMKAVMQREGYQVITGKNGEEGLRLARENEPDIIICDVMMPPPNGFMLKKILSEDEKTAEIPFIFLTARTVDADKVAGLNIGADDYITKPFKADELLARVEAVLRRAELGRKRGLREAEAAMEELRSNIASNLSHEMRTPLGIVLNTLDLAIKDKFSSSSEEMDWYLETARTGAQRLQSLINDLILLNSIDQHSLGKMRQPIDLRFDFLDPIQNKLNFWASKALKLEITIDPGTLVNASLPEFSHAVCHLVDNACKFSPEQGQIGIFLVKNGVGGCVVTITDEGPGIPVELREKVFNRYHQISNGSTRQYGGLGVGLTIARAVAERLGGSVMILDAPGGCKVRMIIPPGENEWDRTKNR